MAKGIKSTLDVSPLVARRSAARQMGISLPTLDRHEREGTAPQSFIHSRRRYYRQAAIDEWLEQRGLTVDDIRRLRSSELETTSALGG
jgi:predicted DNA-binding transcriptional regulator AlpA